MTDQAKKDPLVGMVEKKLAGGAPASEIVTAVLEQLAEDVPPSYRIGVQGDYRAWLRGRAEAAREGLAAGGPVRGELGRWT